MALPLIRWILIAVLVVAGIYLLLFHMAPWPDNHEAIGLGKSHLAHAVVGIVLIVAAGYVWFSGRRKTVAAPAA